VLASRFGLIRVALDDFDSPDDEDFAGVSGFEECIAANSMEMGFGKDLSHSEEL
jgi:hypothetical protein